MGSIITTVISDYVVLAINNFCNHHMSVKGPVHFKHLPGIQFHK